jgi:hypothetical protein
VPVLRGVARVVTAVGVLQALWLPAAVRAEPLPESELERRCWLQHTNERTRVRLVEPTAVDVSNLRDGDTVTSPFRVDFSIRGMGVVPAGKVNPRAGHHHLLVDTALPINPQDQIPFSDVHRHFGKGQTGTVIALPPGPHRLRLLFADHEHRPYFVFSPELRINVRGSRNDQPPRVSLADYDVTCRIWYQEELSRPRPPGKRALISNLRDGEPVISPINLRFVVDGFGVAAQGQGGEGLGFFKLDIQWPDGSPLRTVDLSNGATQTTLSIAPGNYRLQLRFVDDSGRRDLVPAARSRLVVIGQDRL